MVRGYRRLKIQIVVAALCLLAIKASFGTEQTLDCAQVLVGNVSAEGTLIHDTYHRGLIIPRGSRLGFDMHCEASWADTVQAVNYKGVELAAGKLTFNSKGNLQFAPLASSVLPNGASVIGANDQQPVKAVLSAEEKFKEEVFGKNVTAFYDSGFPKQAYLNRPSQINGVWFAKSLEPILFHASGSVASATLERNTNLSNFIIGPGPVRFDESGALREGHLGANTRVGRFVLPTNTRISLNEAGNLESFTLRSSVGSDEVRAEKIKLGELWLFTNTRYSLSDTQHLREFESSDYTWYQDRLYPPLTHIQLAADGSVEWDSYYSKIANASDQQIENGDVPEILQYAQVLRGILLPKGALVFMSDGLVQSVAMPRDFNYANVRLRAGPIYFTGANSVSGTLAMDSVINGVTVPRGTKLEFRHGEVVRANFASNEIEY
jgi:hypothetical protein